MTAEPPVAAPLSDAAAWHWAQNVIAEITLNARMEEAIGGFMVLCRQFHETELARMHLGCPTAADFQYHKRIAALLLGTGVQLLGVATASGQADGEAARRIAARLTALRDSYLSFHESYDPVKTANLRDAIFNAPAA